MTPPKIEELKCEPKLLKPLVKKNPFAVSQNKRPTIRRTADEVYPQRKGLNKPEIESTKPIDLLFTKLEKILDLPYNELTLDILHERIFPQDLTGGNEFDKRYNTVSQLVEYLLEIQKLSSESDFKDKALISVSLHDMKTFGKLVNMIIIHGIYPALSVFNIGIPFDKRRMKEFAQNKDPIKIARLSSNGPYEPHEKLLSLIYKGMFLLFLVKSDVTDLLSRGTGYSDFITVAVALITIPYFKSINKDEIRMEYNNVIQGIPETFELFQIYSLLITTSSPIYFKEFVMKKLQTLHYDAPRGDGLLSLIEFILGLRENEAVNIEKFDHVANVILLKPSTINTVQYFTSIGDQSYELLININRPTVTSCVVYMIEKLWLKNKRVAQDFILKKIWNKFNPEKSAESILVNEAQLNNSVNVLISLNKKTLDPDLYGAIFEPILLSLWGYYLFLKVNKKSTAVITGILTTYFTIMKEYGADISLEMIAKNLFYDGTDNWEYELGPNSMVQIRKRASNDMFSSKEAKVARFVSGLDSACEAFIEILQDVDDELVQGLFIKILKSWLNGVALIGEEQNPFLALQDLRLLESIVNKFKESLAKTPGEMLEIVDSFLLAPPISQAQPTDGEEDSDDEDDEENLREEILPTLLELLSAILSENEEIDIVEHGELLNRVNKSLLNLASKDVNEATKNGAKGLSSRIVSLLEGSTSKKDQGDSDKDILERAIVSLNDPLVPIRAHGLYLLRKLVETKSKVISLDFVINLHLVQLKDPDPFIYLNVIKGLELLISWDEYTVLELLCKTYKDEGSDIDERLRIGEVLLRYIQAANTAFGGKSASLIAETTLTLIRRRETGEETVDNRLRMSSMSLLGTCCKVNPLGIIDRLGDALDCSIGILQLETSIESSIMRRSAVVLMHDLILGTSETDKVVFPASYRESVVNILKYVAETDVDILVREQAQKVLETIVELTTAALELYSTDAS